MFGLDYMAPRRSPWFDPNVQIPEKPTQTLYIAWYMTQARAVSSFFFNG